MAQRMTYQWGRKSFGVDAQTVGEAVEAIATREGYCSPGQLVDEARSEASPLHPLFTWNDEDAATRWRNHEARQVISNLTVTVRVDDEPVTAPAFLSVGHTIATQGSGEGYRPVSVVMRSPEFSQEALGEAIGRLYALRKRYEALDALAPVWEALDTVSSSTPE